MLRPIILEPIFIHRIEVKGTYVLLGNDIVRISEIRSVSKGYRPTQKYRPKSLEKLFTLYIETFSNRLFCKSYSTEARMEQDRVLMIGIITGINPNSWLKNNSKE